MEISFICPHCGEVTLIDEEFVGQSGECRACGCVVTVPKLASTAPMIRNTPSAPIFQLGCAGWIALAVFGILVLLLLLPAVDFGTGRNMVRRFSSANNLKQIALAMHNYHSVYKQLPRAYRTTSAGERTMSWRVAILPFLEQERVFEAYRADEAWNSPMNREVTKSRPDTYMTNGDWGNDRQGQRTAYVVITGPGTLFEEGKDLSLEDCLRGDGTAKTILAVEVRYSDVHWAEPRDLDLRTMIMQVNGAEGNSISSPWKNGANVVMADGHVEFLSNQTLGTTLRAMITRSGGKQIQMPK